MTRRTKIVCTLGPSSHDEATVGRLIDAGMNAARLNFSHGTHEDHRRLFSLVRRVAAERGQPVAVLQDLQGPKIRVGKLPGGSIDLQPGSRVRLFHGESSADRAAIPCTYEPIARDVNAGDELLLDDGRIKLRTLESREGSVTCEVVTGGQLLDRKGINLPGVALSTPALTEKDRADLALGVELGVDFVALSFVRSAEDVAEAASLAGDVPVIAKIEKPEAIDCIEGILDHAAGLMVARGDLGVEMGPERVPMLQKRLINQANDRGKLVITATEMLETMRFSSRPTRAEVSDVANAVFDNTDAVMLSGETASGKYPVEAVETMNLVLCEAERALVAEGVSPAVPSRAQRRQMTTAIARGAVAAADEVGCRAIICYTDSGAVALMTSEYRPDAMVVAATQHLRLYRQLALQWGVTPLKLDSKPATADEAISSITGAAVEAKLLERGQQALLALGSRPDGPSDLIKIVNL